MAIANKAQVKAYILNDIENELQCVTYATWQKAADMAGILNWAHGSERFTTRLLTKDDKDVEYWAIGRYVVEDKING